MNTRSPQEWAQLNLRRYHDIIPRHADKTKGEKTMNEERIIVLLETITHQNDEIIALLRKKQKKREAQDARNQARKDAEKATAQDATSYARQILTGCQRMRRRALYETVKEWCKTNGEPVPHKHAFYQALRDAGFTEVKSSGEYYFTL